jgi:PAS domain S-box-containing protein
MVERFDSLSVIEIFNEFSNPILILDAEGVIQYANSSFQNSFSVNPSSVVGNHFLDLYLANQLSVEELKQAKKRFKKAIKKKIVPPMDYEFKREGMESQYYMTDSSVVSTGDIQVHYVIVSLHNITDRVKEKMKMELEQAKLEIQNLNQYARGLIEVNPDPLVTFNQEGLILGVNEVTIQATGKTREELIGTHFADYFTDPKKAYECVMMVFRVGEVRDYELVMKSTDGSETVVAYNASVYRSSTGEIAGAFAAARDITELKQVMFDLSKTKEELSRKERLAMLGQLSASVGHELRNPLGAIKNGVYFLKMVIENPEDDVLETFSILDKEIENSERIISSLLDFTRPMEPVLLKVILNETIEKVLKHVKVPANITVKTEFSSKIPILLGDPYQLERAFLNLITNACQAMNEGGILLLQTDIDDEGNALAIVNDTGVGIPQENLSKLFQPLFTTKAKGIGLGLSIVRNIVEAHGGSVEVDSEEGKGTTFRIMLPQKRE